MSIELIRDTALLGALIAWTNGEPRPPERFAAKVRIWERANASGRLVRTCDARREKGFIAPALIIVTLGDGNPGNVTLTGRQIMHSVHSLLRFRVVAPPPIGWLRILSSEDEDAELLHLARDRHAAEAWCHTTSHLGAVVREISTDEIAMAAVEGAAGGRASSPITLRCTDAA